MGGRAGCAERSLRSCRMVGAEASNRRARSSTITRPEARAIERISVWRWDNPATAAPLDKVGPWCGGSVGSSTWEMGRKGCCIAERRIQGGAATYGVLDKGARACKTALAII